MPSPLVLADDLLQQTKQAIEQFEKISPVDSAKLSQALHLAASLERKSGRYADAETHTRRLLSLLAPSNSQSMQSLIIQNNLAELLRLQGRFADADVLWQRTQRGFEELLGAGHPHIAAVLNNRGVLAIQEGQYAAAEELLRKAAAIYEKSEETQDSRPATVLTNLASALRLQGRTDEAERVQRRATELLNRFSKKAAAEAAVPSAPEAFVSSQPVASLADPAYRRKAKESLAKKENPPISNQDPYFSANLAAILTDAQRFEEAEPLFQESLQAFEGQLGADAPETSTARLNLAEVYRQAGDADKAEPLIRRALMSKERVLGRKHPDTIIAMNNLGAVCQAQGRMDEADGYYKESLKLGKEVLGDKHLLIATLLSNRAAWFSEQRLSGEAVNRYEEALEVINEHPDTPAQASSRITEQLTALYDKSVMEKVSPEQRRYLRILSMAAESMNHRAVVYSQLGDLMTAENLFKGALAIYEKSFGPNYPETALVYDNYAVLLKKAGRTAQAEAYESRARAIRKPAPAQKQ